eukprot:bmy_08754T0
MALGCDEPHQSLKCKKRITYFRNLHEINVLIRAPLSDKNIDLNGIIQYPRKP